jgi:hypothetical protein
MSDSAATKSLNLAYTRVQRSLGKVSRPVKRASFVLVSSFLVTASLAGCGSKSDSSADNAEGGASGDGEGGGGGSSAKGGSHGSGKGGSTGAGGAQSSAGGSAAGGSAAGGTPGGDGGSSSDAAAGGSEDGGSTDGGSGGSTGEAGSGSGGDTGGGGAAGGSGPGGLPADMLGWYEAEAVPPNTLFGKATVVKCGTAPPCTSIAAVKEGVECCSAGGKVSQLLRGTGGIVANAIEAPADGMYDVTWWYHCGKDDNFGDTTCGGEPHTKSGCRPHILVVNGTKMAPVYHFPCFPGSWGQLHASTTRLPLKAGKTNSIRIYATPGRDAADLDAIAIYPVGKGTPPLIPMGSGK